MADPFALSVQYQDRLNNSTKALEEVPDRFMQGMRIPGIIAQNQLLKNEVKESNEKISANEQIRSMLSNPMGFGKRFGDLKTAGEMRKFIANHAAIGITPLGEQTLGRFERIAVATEQAETHSMERQLEAATNKKRGEFLAGAIDDGIDIKDPDALRGYQFRKNKSKSRAAFDKRANDAGLNPYSVRFDSSAYDAQGNLDQDVADAMLSGASPSQRLVTQREIAEDRTAAQMAIADAREAAKKDGTGTYAPSEVERKILEAEKHGVPFSTDEISDMLRISGGLKPRSAKVMTQAEFINSKLSQFMRSDEANGITRTDEERVDYLKGLHETIFGVQKIQTKPQAGGSKALKWNDQTGELTE